MSSVLVRWLPEPVVLNQTGSAHASPTRSQSSTHSLFPRGRSKSTAEARKTQRKKTAKRSLRPSRLGGFKTRHEKFPQASNTLSGRISAYSASLVVKSFRSGSAAPHFNRLICSQAARISYRGFRGLRGFLLVFYPCNPCNPRLNPLGLWLRCSALVASLRFKQRSPTTVPSLNHSPRQNKVSAGQPSTNQ